MPRRVSLLADVARGVVALPDRAAHALILRDLDAWIRIQALGTLARTGIAAALVDGRTLEEIAARCDVADLDLLAAVLRLGEAVGEVRRRGGRYEIRGRRLRAVAGRSDDLAGVVEEAVTYDARIYRALGEHLRGAPAADHLDGLGDVIARASRIAEPVLGATVRSVTTSVAPSTVLDIGCGTGTYLRHVLDVAPGARTLGIDLDEGAVDEARSLLAGRPGAEIRHVGLDELDPAVDGPFDLVFLLNNLYYWSSDEHGALLDRLRALAPDGTVVIATAVAGPSMAAVNAQLDVALRVTSGCHPLLTIDELDALTASGPFRTVDRFEPVPRLGFAVAICS